LFVIDVSIGEGISGAERVLFEQIRNNPWLWRDVSAQCRAFVETNYSWERSVDSTEELFEKIKMG